MSLTAMKDGILVIIDDGGIPYVFPDTALGEVSKILTTPARVKRAEKRDVSIATTIVTLQPGEPGHAAASFDAAGWSVLT